ncbi:MAG: PqqD family protein [Nitrospiraceae bacterium]
MSGEHMSTECLTKDKNLVTRSIGGEALIVPVRSGVADLECIYALNEVGSRIWELVDERTPVKKIVEAICSEYDVTPEQAARDISELLSSLEAAGLVRGAAQPEG